MTHSNLYKDKLNELYKFFSKDFEGIIRHSETFKELIKLKTYVGKEISETRNIEFNSEKGFIEQVNTFSQLVDNISTATTLWENPLSSYEDHTQQIILGEIKEVIGFLKGIFTDISIYSNKLELEYLNVDKKLRLEYKHKGIYLFYTTNDIFELVRNLKIVNIELAKNIEENLRDFYESIISEGNYSLSIGDFDIHLYRKIITELKGVNVSDELQTKILFYIDNNELLTIKKKYIFKEDVYKEKLKEQINQIIHYIDNSSETLNSKDVPTLIHYLGEDVKFRSDLTKSITVREIIKVLNKYPTEVILNIEREFYFGDFELNFTLYQKILEELLYVLNIETVVTEKDVYKSLGDIEYKALTVKIFKDLLSTGDYNKYKISILNKDIYFDKISTFYEENKGIIVDAVKTEIFSQREHLVEIYTNALNKFNSITLDKNKLKLIEKNVIKLSEEMKPLGVNFDVSYYEDNTNRLLVTITFNGEELLFDLHYRYLVNLNTMVCIYQGITELQDLQDKSLLNSLDDSQTFLDMSIRLLQCTKV